MMARVLLSGILLEAFAGESMADCTNNRIASGNDITTLISGSLICGRPGSGYTGNPADRWQDQHRSDHTLWDHKLGIGNAVDPETQVGTWSTQNGANSTYTESHGLPPTYTGGPSYTYQVYRIGAVGSITYSFCVGASEMVVGTINAGQGVAGQGCTSYP